MIRTYQPTDIEDVLHVWTEASALAHPFLTADFIALEKERIRDVHMPSAQSWVYEANGRVVGFIALLGTEVGAVFVEPTWHRRGVGEALMNTVRSLCPTLEVDVFEANTIGRTFYAKYGFEPIGEHVHDETGQRVLRLRYTRP